jgi:uncharacterized protein (TIGR02147 family)
MLIGRFQDYRHYLKGELETRIQRNATYSLRAFARDLKMMPQVLSLVLNGKKGLSTDAALHIAERLKLGVEDTAYFIDLVHLNQAKTDAARKLAQYRLSQYPTEAAFNPLQEEVFKIISDWYHYAILELTFTGQLSNDAKSISKRLGITEHEAKQAIARLLKVGLLENQDGVLIKSERHITSTHDLPSAGLRKYHSQILDRAKEALESQDVGERDITGVTMAIDPSRLPEAKAMIKEFRRQLMTLLETGERAEVYQFSAQLFRLSKVQSKTSH